MLSLAERSRLRGRLERYEGRVPHMYLDTRGRVTVGVGHLLSNVDSAQRLPFMLADDTGKRATREQVAADYKALMALRPAEHHSFYRPHTTLRLADAAIDALTEQHIDSFHRELRVIYRSFDRLPGPVRLALFDMIFNLGATGLRSEWPRLNKAIGIGDWRTAARESFRPDVQDERNTYVRKLFESAALAEVTP